MGEAAVISVEPQVVRFGDEVHVQATGAHVVPRLGRWEVVEQHADADGWSATLRCLDLRCGTPAVLVGSVRRTFPVTVRSRGAARLQAQTTPQPWRYRVGWLWIAVAAFAAALLLGAAWVVRPRRVDTRSPLERAIAAVREARRRPSDDRRRAVGALAFELRRLERPEAERSDRLAWSERDPEPAELDALADAVEAT